MMGQHGSTFKQHLSYLYHSKGRVHMFFTRFTPVIDTILLLRLKHNIILDVCLLMQEHLPHFCPFLCLNSFIIAQSVLTPILELPYKHWSAGSLQDGKPMPMTTWNSSPNGISFWHRSSKTSEILEVDLVGTISFTASAASCICPFRDKD